MYSVAVGIRPYGQLEEHYEENMLSQMHLFIFYFFIFLTEQQRVTRTAGEKGARK